MRPVGRPLDLITSTPDPRLRWLFDPVPGFAGAVDAALAGEVVPDPVVVDGLAELALVAGALVWLDAVVSLPVL